MPNESIINTIICQLKCSEHQAKPVQICNDSKCFSDSATFLCQLCYMVHPLDHIESKVFPVSEYFSANLLESLKIMIDQNNASQFEKIDYIYEKLQNDLLKMMKNHKQCVMNILQCVE